LKARVFCTSSSFAPVCGAAPRLSEGDRVSLWQVTTCDSHPLGAWRATAIPMLDHHELAAGKLAACWRADRGRRLGDGGFSRATERRLSPMAAGGLAAPALRCPEIRRRAPSHSQPTSLKGCRSFVPCSSKSCPESAITCRYHMSRPECRFLKFSTPDTLTFVFPCKFCKCGKLVGVVLC